MNGVKTELHVRVEQTARGIWYCSGLDVYAENYLDLAVEIDLAMGKIEEILFVHNSLDESEKQHTDLSTRTDAMSKALKVKK